MSENKDSTRQRKRSFTRAKNSRRSYAKAGSLLSWQLCHLSHTAMSFSVIMWVVLLGPRLHNARNTSIPGLHSGIAHHFSTSSPSAPLKIRTQNSTTPLADNCHHILGNDSLEHHCYAFTCCLNGDDFKLCVNDGHELIKDEFSGTWSDCIKGIRFESKTSRRFRCAS